jgi:hypothetical protein
LKVAEACLDGYAKFEMEAYILSMQSNYLMEIKKWESALNKLLQARTIFTQVLKYKDSIEAVIYQEKLG